MMIGPSSCARVPKSGNAVARAKSNDSETSTIRREDITPSPVC